MRQEETQSFSPAASVWKLYDPLSLTVIIENPDLLATKIIVPHYIVERESCKTLVTEP